MVLRFEAAVLVDARVTRFVGEGAGEVSSGGGASTPLLVVTIFQVSNSNAFASAVK